MASPTVLIFSACSSGMVISNSSSSSMTSSTISRESAPMSSVKEVLRVTCSLLTPRFSQTMLITRSSVVATIRSSQSGSGRAPRAAPRSGAPEAPSRFGTACWVLTLGYLPQKPQPGQANLTPARPGQAARRAQTAKLCQRLAKEKGNPRPPPVFPNFPNPGPFQALSHFFDIVSESLHKKLRRFLTSPDLLPD